MKQNEFNPVIKAVQSLRKLALDVKADNEVILSKDKMIMSKLEESGRLIVGDENINNQWLLYKNDLQENVSKLRGIIATIENKIKNKDASDLLSVWESQIQHKDVVVSNLSKMEKIGEVAFVDEKLNNWKLIWADIQKYLNEILSVVENYSLKLKAMEALKPEEIDELTNDILKHIPWNYSDEEASKYEKEYIQAYEDLKAAQSQKKNLWDKVMNILAGGVVETPAHVVQMKRWMEGDQA